DQRIEADVRNLTQLMLTVLTIFVESSVQLFGFVGVLLSISHGLTGFLLVYALLGSAITILFFGKRLTRINAEQIKREANFRFNLTEIRDHAEAIALHRSQQFSNARARDRFQRVINNFNRFIRWQLGLDCFQNAYQYLTFILPSLILAPSILNGPLEVGAIVQSQAAFDRIWLSLSLIIVQFEQLTALAASTGRLQQLLQAMSPASHPTSQQSLSSVHAADIYPSDIKTSDIKTSEIKRVQQETLAVQHLTLYLPPLSSADLLIDTSKVDTSKTEQQPCLFRDLSFVVNEPLLVMGESGVGKSSLVKAIAGLWQNGKGKIISPNPSTHHSDSPSQQSSIIFLPQQPYTTLGSLRQQLLYPAQSHGKPTPSDNRLRQILEQVQLAYLGELDQIADWSGQLSTGEQQRLAFARLFVHQPAFAILDEATSALSVTQEASLYRQLSATQTAFISVGHRPSLRQYHAQLLTLTDKQTWTLVAL
ncbi:MAG: ATP-binding cassette domain-containing protein, partial [Cyanobacteria bacterium J06627_28]